LRRSARIASFITSATLALALAGCAQPEVAGSDSGPGRDIQVGMAYDVGGRGDQSFNDAAARGLDRATQQFDLGSKEL
jgi:basic membrane protein A and related proteins